MWTKLEPILAKNVIVVLNQLGFPDTFFVIASLSHKSEHSEVQVLLLLELIHIAILAVRVQIFSP